MGTNETTSRYNCFRIYKRLNINIQPEKNILPKAKPPVFSTKTGGFGPSGETRTRGILDPNGIGRFFLLPKRRIFCDLLQITNFLITIIPLILTIILLFLVKYVVKNREGGAKLRHLLPTETLFGVYHRSPKMSSQLQRTPLPSKSICLNT